MILDFTTQESLEIFANSSQEEENKENKAMKYGCLADLLDNTTTPFGRRLLRKWLGAPLIDATMITLRQEAVDDLLANYEIVE